MVEALRGPMLGGMFGRLYTVKISRARRTHPPMDGGHFFLSGHPCLKTRISFYHGKHLFSGIQLEYVLHDQLSQVHESHRTPSALNQWSSDIHDSTDTSAICVSGSFV